MTTQFACQQCGKPVDAGAQFCSHCGNNVSAAQDQLKTRQVSSSPTQQMFDQLLQRLRDATLGEYEIMTELGRGGMATVYLGHDLQLDRKVAIKVMLPALLEGEGMIDRFKLEARTAAQLSHPHIIPIFAVRDTEELLFFVMKFVEGRALDSISKEVGKVPIRMAQSILARVGEALGYAHRRGVVHRDIKPANLMIDVEGQPVVTDFGIAKVSEARGLTMTGATVGTPHYMSPEQCMAGKITGASDQYSLGVVAYEMLSGQLPFQGDSVVSLLYKHVHEPPPPFLDARPDCPPQLHDAIMRMLAKEPEERFPTMEAAVDAIGAVTLPFDDPLRTQLVTLAKKGVALEALKRVSTPRSPTPIRSRTISKRTGGLAQQQQQENALSSAATIRATPMTTASPKPVPGPLAPAARSNVAKWAVGGIAVIALIAAAWLRPWEKRAVPTTPARVASLTVEPATQVIDIGATLQLAVTARDSAGQPMAPSISWSTPDTAIATVTPTGQVTGKTAGLARILANAGGTVNIASITVAAPLAAPAAGQTAGPAVRILIQGAPASLTAGNTGQLRAIPVDARNAPAADRAVTWTSSAPNVATISRAGLISARSPGTVVLTARSGSITQNIPLRVDAPQVAAAPAPVAQPAATPQTPTPGPAAANSSATAPANPAPVTSAPAPAPATTPAAPPAAAPDPRDAINDVIAEYARALESKSVANVRRVYPGMTGAQETQLSQTLSALDQLQVHLRVGSLDVQGDVATAAVSGEYVFRADRRSQTLPVRMQATLERGPSGWRIRTIRDTSR